jgi:hypothetical protein
MDFLVPAAVLAAVPRSQTSPQPAIIGHKSILRSSMSYFSLSINKDPKHRLRCHFY